MNRNGRVSAVFGGDQTSNVSTAEAYEIGFRRSAAANMRLARVLGVAFVFVQTWMYVPPDDIDVPYDLTALAAGVAVAAIVISVVGALLARSPRLTVLRMGSWLEIGGDTAVVIAIIFAFAFDIESQLWALMMLPAVEAAWRHRLPGALVTWVLLTSGYTAREVFAATRYDYAEFLGHSVTYRTGLTLVITFIAALQARSLHVTSIEQLEATQALARQARTDTLTGLANRDHFLERVDAALASATRCAVLMLDVDRFRLVNDSHGHQVGDVVLSALASHLADHAPPAELLARTGGNEYRLLMVGEHDPAAASSLASQLQQRVTDPIHADGRAFHLTASAAVLICDGRQRTADEVERDVTLAMYAAKRQGLQGLAAFQPSMATTMNRRTTLLHDLPEALATGQLRIEYQPILRADGVTPAGFEALVRWQHSDHGAIAPLEIIDIAAASGVGTELFHAALDDACLQLARWRETLTGAFVTVNVASNQIDDVDATVTRLIELIAQHGLDSRSVVLEITETDIVHSSMPVEQLLAAARQHGVRIAIDDFGREHSSLARLRTLEVDIVKLDRELVLDMTTPHHAPEALRAVVRLVETYGYLVLAEGIETDQQYKAVTAAGCQLLQGFHFAGPMPADDILNWIQQRDTKSPTQPGSTDVIGGD